MIGVDMSEVDKLARDLAAAPERKQREARRVAQGAAEGLKRRAKADAPRDRPWLAARGIRRKTWDDRTGVNVNVYTAWDDQGRNVGFFVEYGTSEMPPQPFIGPHVPQAQRELVDGMNAIADPFEQRPISDFGTDD